MQSIETEIWKPVVGWEGFYQVSDLGKVRRIAPGTATHVGRMLAHHVGSNGYPRVTLTREGKSKQVHVHELILEAFVGPRPEGHVACHNDGNSLASTLTNLRWDSQSGNMADTLRHGRHPNASKTHCAQGHEFTPGNTRIYRGARVCKECKRIRARCGYVPTTRRAGSH